MLPFLYKSLSTPFWGLIAQMGIPHCIKSDTFVGKKMPSSHGASNIIATWYSFRASMLSA